MYDIHSRIEICEGMDLMGMLVLISLAVAMLTEKKVRNERLNYMFCMIISCLFMLISDIIQAYVLEGFLPISFYIHSESALYVSMVAATIFLSFYMLRELRKSDYIAEDVNYVLVFMAMMAIAIWFVGITQEPNWFFDLSGEIPANKTGNILIQTVPALIMLFDLFLAASFSGEVRAKYLRTWIIVCLLPLISVGVGSVVTRFPSYAIGSLSCLILFFVIHNDATKQQLINEKELVASKSQLMVSQIQPHFIYNSLNTIYYLIDIDQEQAKDAVNTFSSYLRQNINALKDDKPIPFSGELEHIKAYVRLEKLRFGDRLNVIYDVDTDSFLVPPLTIQPLVENAIKHGISVKEEGGTVTITTRDTADGVLLEIADDGAGFDTKRFSDDGKSTHVGLYNVRSRLKSMCNAELNVVSETGKGTVCSIFFKNTQQ